MNSSRRTVLPLLRSAVGPINRGLNAVLDSTSNPPDVHTRESNSYQDTIYVDRGEVNTTTLTYSSNDNDIVDEDNQLPNFLYSAPVASRDVVTIRNRVDNVLDALQNDQMTPAELSLIQTVRDTASDPSIMTKIVNNSSFQEFMNKYVPSTLLDQRPQIGESSNRARGRNTRLADESDSEGEYEEGMQRRRASSSSSSSTTYRNQYDSDEEFNLSQETRRAQLNENGQSRTVQEKAFNRLTELCHQISPELGLLSSTQRSTDLSDKSETNPLNQSEAEVDAIKPTMEGAGVPGMLRDPDTPPAQPPTLWSNPLYFFMVTACILPLITLALTTAVHPSPRTWSLLRSGFKAVCARVFA